MDSGTTLGPYEIHEQIGAGGMGEVYRATRVQTEPAIPPGVSEEWIALLYKRLFAPLLVRMQIIKHETDGRRAMFGRYGARRCVPTS